jgi:prepilin-type N-terminal cleavage/methylation domain-containing protein
MGNMKKITIPKGFSLVEILIVIAIIAIMATFAIPTWQRYSKNTSMKTAAREIMADIYNTRLLAIEKNLNTYRITFNTSANNYSLSRADTGVTSWTKSPSFFESSIRLNSSSFGGGNVISFQQRGTVTAGTITLNNGLGSNATITVQLTGRANVQYTMQK